MPDSGVATKDRNVPHLHSCQRDAASSTRRETVSHAFSRSPESRWSCSPLGPEPLSIYTRPEHLICCRDGWKQLSQPKGGNIYWRCKETPEYRPERPLDHVTRSSESPVVRLERSGAAGLLLDQRHGLCLWSRHSGQHSDTRQQGSGTI